MPLGSHLLYVFEGSISNFEARLRRWRKSGPRRWTMSREQRAIESMFRYSARTRNGYSLELVRVQTRGGWTFQLNFHFPLNSISSHVI